MKNSPSTLAAIRSVFDEAASHICSAEPNCCRGCTLARQIPGLLDDIAELRAEVARLTPLPDQTYRDGYKTGRMHAGGK